MYPMKRNTEKQDQKISTNIFTRNRKFKNRPNIIYTTFSLNRDSDFLIPSYLQTHYRHTGHTWNTWIKREDVNGNRTPPLSMFIRQRIPRAFPIPSKRSGCRPYLATLHTLPEIGSWEQCLVTEEDLRIISQAGFRLAAPLWNQIQASGRSSMFARFRIEKIEDWR